MNIVRSLSCVLLLCCLGLAACGSHPAREERTKKPASTENENLHTQLSEAELRLEADKLYRQARKQLDSHDYANAMAQYDKLIARYPFTDYGTQAELEKAYAQYRSYQYDDAASAADHFLRDHPRHAHVDYVQYLKGLIEYDRNASAIDWLPIDTAQSDVGADELAFNDFALLIQKYPSSRYVADARLRMVYLRNRVAQHQLDIVKYYVRRGAYVAAARRCEEIIQTYPGAPATGPAAQLLEESYRKVGLTQQADDVQALIAANPGLMHPVKPAPLKRVTVTEAAGPAPTTTAVSDASATTPAANLPAAPAPDALPPADGEQQDKGFFGWFAHLFAWMDTSKPENQHTIIIPTGTATPGTTSAPAATTSGGAAPSADSSSAAAPGAPTGSAAPAAAAGQSSNTTVLNHLHVTVGPEPGDEWHPVDEKPAAVGGATKADPTAPAPANTGATPPSADSSGGH